ncbi:hypothetical protein CSQ96_16460 [Janthinobacterium sp. BJB412]|nr:hypothetical protein CSQ96_16460 [Janthinobacterium sp. BJB412]
MSSSPYKDYIDAKSEAVSASVFGEIKAFRAEVNARFAEVNARLDIQEQLIRSGKKSLQEELNTKFAQLESTFRHAHNDMLKWVVGSILACFGLSLSVSTLLLSNSMPKTGIAAPAPVAPSATTPSPAPAANRQQAPAPRR